MKVCRSGRALVALLLCVVAACTTERGRQPERPLRREPRSGGMVAFGVLGAPATLDPYSPVASDLTRALVRPVYPSLYRFLPDGRTVPSLARSATRAGDVVTIELERRRWSDGRPILARDVVASWRRAGPPSGFAAFDEVRAQGERTVALSTATSEPERALASAAFILPRGRAGLVSGGPFQVTSRREGLEVVYRPDPEWSGSPPHLGVLKVRFVQSFRQLLALLDEGRLDAAALPSMVNLGEIVGRDLELRGVLGWETVYLDLEGSSLGRADRAAVIGALDREAIAEAFVRGDGRVTDALPSAVSAPARGASEGGSVERVQISTAAGDELLQLIQRAVFRQLEAAGLESDLVGIEPEVFYGRWGSTSPTHVELRRSTGGPPYLPSPPARAAFPLFRVRSFIASSPRLHGARPNPTFEGPLWNVERWWLEASG
ncbi:MAG: ABC transporter substrate-binding protein [Actinomycetota bacterium]